MMAGIEARGRAAAEARAAARRRAMAAAVAAQVPGVNARVEGEAVILSGAGLMARWAGDPWLRNPALWGQEDGVQEDRT
jgi:hypothetical protein